jgi:hypothetical protein
LLCGKGLCLPFPHREGLLRHFEAHITSTFARTIDMVILFTAHLINYQLSTDPCRILDYHRRPPSISNSFLYPIH